VQVGSPIAVLYSFEDFSLDVDRRELRHGTDLVPVEPQVFDLLHLLICNRDRVITKEDLIATVWKGRVVSDSALTSRMAHARHAICDNGDQQRLIRTISRKGVRFVGPVVESDGISGRDANTPSAAATPGIAADAGTIAPPKISVIDDALSGTAAATSRAPALAFPDRPSIAVLAFTNLGSDPAQEYLADGIVEDIITELSRFSELFVIARNSSFQYKARRPTFARLVASSASGTSSKAAFGATRIDSASRRS